MSSWQPRADNGKGIALWPEYVYVSLYVSNFHFFVCLFDIDGNGAHSRSGSDITTPPTSPTTLLPNSDFFSELIQPICWSNLTVFWPYLCFHGNHWQAQHRVLTPTLPSVLHHQPSPKIWFIQAPTTPETDVEKHFCDCNHLPLQICLHHHQIITVQCVRPFAFSWIRSFAFSWIRSPFLSQGHHFYLSFFCNSC